MEPNEETGYPLDGANLDDPTAPPPKEERQPYQDDGIGDVDIGDAGLLLNGASAVADGAGAVVEGAGAVAGGAAELVGEAASAAGELISGGAEAAGSVLEGLGGCLDGCAGCSLALLVAFFLMAGTAMAVLR